MTDDTALLLLCLSVAVAVVFGLSAIVGTVRWLKRGRR